MEDKYTQWDKEGATPTRGREACFRGIFFIEGRWNHTNPRRTRAEAEAELKDYAKRMPWVNASHVEEIDDTKKDPCSTP